MASSRSQEIRLWWPLPLAALIWLLITWGVGFLLSLPEVEIDTPPPIAASFIDLNETEDATNSLPASAPSAPTPPQEKPVPTEVAPKPAQKMPAPSAQSLPPARLPKPKVADKAVSKKPEKTTPDRSIDLSDFINKNRAKRGEPGIFDHLNDMPPNNALSSPNEARMANVRRNLQTAGTSGIFQILRIGPRTAEFSFRAWTTGQSNPRLQYIQVDAGPDGSVERAIIRRMIQLIREYYKEDFNWESHRLHRVVVLSAREKDTKGLEDFLMREFFVN
ncbi:hypothetical protein W03_16290 [Nitrosomonas sp. PY1]|uniref:hypothetical protein n=1 Tax=Nitrosomonas sp. PY1 TaxID=1803906 RepID=UPI001FC8421F|nr:hypothetical protein [Nitrosomonas sp. PY1]GKS69625.1 hypothetical protein W03_16290 [Nitrosomonas sp. PY1]